MNQFRLALRSLRRSPGFTLIAGLALALGIGANTAVFSVINAVMLRPLPYPDAERVLRVYNHWTETPAAAISPAEYFDYADGTREVFSAFGVYGITAVALTTDELAERVPGAALTAGALEALGVAPLHGRLFTAREDGAGAAPIVLLSEAAARRRFGRADIVGRQIEVNGVRSTVVGVMPAAFRLPTDFSGPATEVLAPLGLDRAAVTARGSHFLVGVARLAPGVPVQRATDQLQAIAAELTTAFPDDYPRDMRFGVHLTSLRQDIAGDVRPVLLVLLAAVGLVLLVACANVASLTLTRADARRREFAVRTALGAGRSRIVRQLLAESLTLAALGGAAGVLLASWSVSGLLAIQPGTLPRGDAVSLDLRVLAFAAAATLITALLFGLAPLLQSQRVPITALRESSRSASASAPRQRFRQMLVSLELALAVVLLSGAGLLLRSFARLLQVQPGYDVENVLTTRINLPPSKYPDDLTRRNFFTQLEQRAASLPGVAAAGAVTQLPLSNPLGDLNIQIEGRVRREGEVSPRLDWQAVTPGYFRAIGMRVLRGRQLLDSDDENAAGVVVLNESAARLHFPDEEAIGRRFRLGGNAGPGWVTVVGIVQDIRHARLDQPPRPEMYLAHRQFRFWNGGLAANALTLAVRGNGNALALVPAVRQLVREIDPAVPTSAFRTMEEVRADSVAQPRFVTTLLTAFALITLLLAAVGAYGLIAYGVALRRQELGVRIALGAGTAEILALALRHGLTAAAAGIVTGAAATFLLNRSLSSMLFGITPHDPATLTTVIAVLALTSLAACIVPARRALRTDPMVSMRSD
jgi:putative ABC transport system permease protein